MNELPQAYIAQMKRLLGEAGFFAYEKALGEPVTRALRVNLLLFPDGAPPCAIEGLGEPVPWAKGAYFIEGDARPGLSPLHEGGLYYMQEPSAMTAVSALCPQPGERVLDLCAAPGGKSTQIAALMAGRGLLVCNEPVPSRAQILSRNVERMGVRNAVVTCALPDQLSPRFAGFFDRILVDAPCSGEGMFRRHPEARAEWNADSPARCAARQAEILNSAAQMLRPGGRLAYSTCTFNSLENEGSIKRFLAEHPDFHPVPFALPGLPAAPQGILRLWPHHVRGEGHFVALLEKDGNASPALSAPPLPAPDRAALQAYAAFADETGCVIVPNAVFGGHLIHAPVVLPPLDRIRTLRVGLQVGELRGKVFIPDHALALGTDIPRQYPLTDAQALAYLHGEALPCDETMRGFYTVTMDGYALGFCKASNGQLKNHYPKGLRKSKPPAKPVVCTMPSRQ